MILEIQSLRAYAIILTIIAHFGTLQPQFNPILGYFWLGGGVDLFFCISGFVIARSLFQKSADSYLAFSLPFFIKRVFRLWPAAIFWSLATLLLSLFFNSSGVFSTFENNLSTTLAAWFQVVNLKIVLCKYYHLFDCAYGSPVRIYWSLSLEEQFYLIFPTLLFFLRDKKIAMLALFLFAAQFFLARTWPSPLWFFRTDAICLGVLIAWLHYRGYAQNFPPKWLEKPALRIISSISLCALLFLVAKTDGGIWFYNGLVSLVAGLLVYIASFDRGYFLKRGYLLKISAFIGERSYSMYLTHMICFVLIKEISIRYMGTVPKEGLWAIYFAVISTILIMTLSEFSYRIVEQPLRNFGRRLALKKYNAILAMQKG